VGTGWCSAGHKPIRISFLHKSKREIHKLNHIEKEVIMNPSELSILVFGIYLVVVAVGFLFMPNAILPLFKMPKTNEQWIRVMAVVVGVLAFYYIVAALNNLTPYFWATVYGRFGVMIAFTALVLSKKAKSPLILFGLIDAAGAIWTLVTLT
jgi:hypothetical protein